MPTSRCDWPAVEVRKEPGFERLSLALFFHFSHNYLWHFVCGQPSTTPRIPSQDRPENVHRYPNILTISRLLPLTDGQIFPPPLSTAIWTTYKHLTPGKKELLMPDLFERFKVQERLSLSRPMKMHLRSGAKSLKRYKNKSTKHTIEKHQNIKCQMTLSR